MEPRTARSGLLLVACGALLGAFSPSSPVASLLPEAPSSPSWEVSYARTDVALDPSAPIRAGRNVAWCATIQLAWDALVDAVGQDGRLDLAAPPPAAAAAARLNARRFPRDAIDEASCIALAGLVRDGVLPRLGAAWYERFPGAGPPPEIQAGPEDVVAFGALRKDLPFETPFRVHPGLTPFGETGAGVRTFGMFPQDRGADAERMARQVVVYGDVNEYGEVVVELLPKGGGDRIVLSSLAPDDTLEGTWRSAWGRLSDQPPRVLEAPEEMVVPRIRMDLERAFADLEGAALARIPDARIGEARQRIEFGLSERGAILRSAAVVVAVGGLSHPIRFDRPFLLALRRAGAARPYFLLWVGSEDLLDRSLPEPASSGLLRPLVGTWALDGPRSIEHNAPVGTGSEGSARDQRWLRDAVERLFRTLDVEMEIRASGDGVWRQRERPAEGREARPWRTTKGRVMALHGRPVFVPVVVPPDPGEEAPPEDGRDPGAPWDVEIEGRLLRVRVPDTWVVFQRRWRRAGT